MKGYAWILSAAVLVLAAPVWAGQFVYISDPRHFERQQEVIFPNAEVKLVTFEFEAGPGDERGKLRARELHNTFLAKIHDLQGGAIITYVTAPGQRIGNYRIAAVEVARQQKAQMALWGRVLVDKSEGTLISTRLELIEAPAGISGEYKVIVPYTRIASGVVDAPVNQLRVDFNVMIDDLTPIAYFLSGLARYYKAAVREEGDARRWLRSSIGDFDEYVRRVSERTDAGALAQAHLYLARAYVRLSAVDRANSREWLRRAAQEGQDAARLNPFDASVPMAQAVVSARQGAPLAEVTAHLIKATTLAPADAGARINLAMVYAVEGQWDRASCHLESAEVIFCSICF
jgi:hypothetical protein